MFAGGSLFHGLAVPTQSRTLHPMSRLALAFLLMSLACPASAQDVAAPDNCLAFVYDGSGAHISGDRVRRALAASLQRPVLRLTDPGAETAPGRLTIAFDAPDHWVIDFVHGDVHTTRTIVLRTSSVARLARIATAIVAETEPGPSPSRPVTPSARRGEWIALIGDEILDPFAGMPTTRSRRSLALVQELVDPFSGSPTGRRRYDDVIDPWSR